MNLISMEVTKSEAEKMYGIPSALSDSSDAPKYPYGLQIRLEKEDLMKLGIKDLPKVGTDMKLIAEVEVVSISQNESKEGEPSQCVCLQIEMMSLSAMADDPSDQKQDPSQTLYGQGS